MKSITDRIKHDRQHSGGSEIGYSFLKSYQACPRRFSMENILGVITPGMKWALKQGILSHSGLELMYLGYTWEDIKHYVHQMTDDMDNDDEREVMNRNVIGMLETWKSEFLERDLENFTDFEFEVDVKIPLLGGLYMTGRLDKTYTDPRTGAMIIGDYKTTKTSITQMTKNCRQGDQFTLYTHGLKQLNPDRRIMTVVDIIWGRELKAGWTVNVARDTPIIYTQPQLDQAVTMYSGLVLEIAQKVKAFYDGTYPLEFLFPRNGSFCGTFGCPYEDICRHKIDRGYLLSQGYDFDNDKITDLQKSVEGIEIINIEEEI